MAAVTAPGSLKKSFAEILSGSSHDPSPTQVPVLTDSNGPRQGLHRGGEGNQSEGFWKGLHRGKPAAFFSSPKLSSYAVPFKRALIGKFSQGRPRMEDIHKFFVSLDLKGGFKLGLLDNRHIVINFHLEEDFHRIFSRLTWNVFRWPMRVFKYTVDFHVNKESSIVPIWVNFERLPLVLFNKEALFTITSLIGTPLRLDTATAELKRPSVARVQVEIDLLKPVPDTVWIGMGEEDGFWQEVKYENRPSYCVYCWHLGHSEDHCMVKHPELNQINKPKIVSNKMAPPHAQIYRPKHVQLPPTEELAANQMKDAVEKNNNMVEKHDSMVNKGQNIVQDEGWAVVQSRKSQKQQAKSIQSDNSELTARELGFSHSVVIEDVPGPSSIILVHDDPQEMGCGLVQEQVLSIDQENGLTDTKQGNSLVKEHLNTQVIKQQIIQLQEIHTKAVEKEFVTDFVVAQEKGFPTPIMLKLMRTRPKDNQEKETSSNQSLEESQGQQLQQSPLHDSELSKAMVVYSQGKRSAEVPESPNIEKFRNEEIQHLVQESMSEATNELIENIADKVVQEDNLTFHKKSFAEVLLCQPPQAIEELSLQPLQCIFPSTPQVKDFTQEEIQNLVQEGIIVESGKIDPTCGNDDNEDNEDDEEHLADEIDYEQMRLIQSGNLSPRKSRGSTYSLRPRRKYNKYRDFHY